MSTPKTPIYREFDAYAVLEFARRVKNGEITIPPYVRTPVPGIPNDFYDPYANPPQDPRDLGQ